MSKNSPVAFFAYKRPDHTRRALESLAQNEGADNTELFVFCEGPKHPQDVEGVEKTREVVKSRQWCGKVHIVEREHNLGCANSISLGVTEVCKEYGRVIVLEDDLVLSPYFMNYMNRTLEFYEFEPQVMQVSGYMFPIQLNTHFDTVFLPFTSSWGWATWWRAWKEYDPTMSSYTRLKNDRELRYLFDLNGSYPYFKMLEDELSGRIDTWDIRWYLSFFMLKGFALFPTQTLVQNIGFDGSGTHCGDIKAEEQIIKNTEPINFQTQIQLDQEAFQAICQHLRSIRRHPLRRFASKLKYGILRSR